VVEIVK